MYCTYCGAQNSDDAAFCVGCGQALANNAQSASVAGAGAGVAAASAATAASASTSAPTPAPATAVTKGCVGQAWSDITSSPNWVKRLLILMLMNCVPVMRYFSSGYALQWGAQAAKNNPQPLEAGCFAKRTFLFGLVVALLDALLALGTLVFALAYLIPVLGAILVIAIDLLATSFCTMSQLRVGTTGRLGSAFDLSELFRAYRKNLGGLVVAAVVPNLICTAIILVVVIIVLFFVGVSGYAAFSDMSNYNYGYGFGVDNSSFMPGWIIGMLSGLVVVVVFVVLFAMFVGGLGNLWTMRSVGYWVARNEGQWAHEGTPAKWACDEASEGSAHVAGYTAASASSQAAAASAASTATDQVQA